MRYRFATESDLDILADWNQQLIHDEGHRNSMTKEELRERMKKWLKGEYKAVLFGRESDPVAYAMYRENETEIYLRQFFVRRGFRRQGIGRKAVNLLKNDIWSSQKRLMVDVLTANVSAVEFWRSVGYRDYSLTLEILPSEVANRRVR